MKFFCRVAVLIATFSAVQAEMIVLPPAAPVVDLLLQLNSNPDLVLPALYFIVHRHRAGQPAGDKT